MFHTVPTAQGSTHQICSKLYEKKEERGIDPSDCAQLFPRNSNRIPTETRPNQCSLCAHLLDFPSPLDTALSVPCNPGPASASSVDCRNLQVAFKKLSQQSQRIGTLNAERAIYIYIYMKYLGVASELGFPTCACVVLRWYFKLIVLQFSCPTSPQSHWG